MSSELGRLIRQHRERLDIGLRELARRIGKSPAFVVALELERNPPGVAEETLREVGRELGIDADLLVTLAGKTPEDVAPKSPLEVALYRKIRALPEHQQKRLLENLDSSEWKQ